ILPGDGQSRATATNKYGATIIGTSYQYEPGPVVEHAFVWTADSGMRSLQDVLVAEGVNLDGWSLTRPVGVSDDGSVFTGNAINPQGETEAYVVSMNGPKKPTVVARHVFYNHS